MATPWEITPEMFLAPAEVDDLLQHAHRRVAQSTGRSQITARLDEFIIETLLYSGLRNSEFCSLTLNDTVVGTGQPAFHIRNENGENRIVHLPAVLIESIHRWVHDTRPLLLPKDVDPNDLSQPLVFNEHRRPYERTGLYRRVVRILTEAGLGERASVQLLRHTYGYLAYRRTGGNLLFVQRQLGHAHPMITSIYAQFADESYETMADRVSRNETDVPVRPRQIKHPATFAEPTPMPFRTAPTTGIHTRLEDEDKDDDRDAARLL